MQNNIQKTIFHQIILSKDPVSFDGQNLQIVLINENSKATTKILSPEEFRQLQSQELDKDAKKIKKLVNWDKIKFNGKVNKISDIPENLIKEYGIPQFGFRFYKGVVLWSGNLSNLNGKSTEENNKDGGLIAFDGQNVIEIRDEENKEIKNYYGSQIGTYYLSSLIKNGIGYNFSSSCGGWGCNITEGFFINFDKGQYWRSLEGVDKDNYNRIKVSPELIKPYLDEDFSSQKVFRPKIYNGTGYQIYRDGKIYGRFQKYTGKIKDGYPESSGYFVVENDGQNYKFLYEAKSNCQNPMVICGGEMVFNSRGNLVYFGQWYEEGDDWEKPENQKIKISEQDFTTGKVLQEEIAIKNTEILKKYGLTKIN